MKTTLGLSCLLFSSMTFAAQTVTLSDGRQVQLNDDFTWQYVVEAVPSDPAAAASVIPVKPIAAIPVVNKKVASVIELGSQKPVMQLSDSGIDLLLGTAQYQSGQLIIETSLTNQSTQSVVLVEVEVELIDTSAAVIARETFSVWTSIKRLADTYLRPQQVAAGKPIKIDIERAEQYQISAKIIQVEAR